MVRRGIAGYLGAYVVRGVLAVGVVLFVIASFVVLGWLATSNSASASPASSASGAAIVNGAAVASVRIISVDATPHTISANGGTVKVNGYAGGAETCKLLLKSAQTVRVSYATNARPCRSTGKPFHFTAKVVIAPIATYNYAANPQVAQTITFRLIGRNGQKETGRTFTIDVAAASTVPITTTTVPITTTTAPVVTTTVPVGTTVPVVTTTTTPGVALPPPTATTTTTPAVTTTTAPQTQQGVHNINWSGYVYSGGPFTEANGTFTVPYLTTAATCGSTLANWVGIDGVSPDENLIQAGVDESDTNPSTGACTPGSFYIWAWWEIVPALSTPELQVTVHAGDSVTVAIWQYSPGMWAMQVTDNTDGQSFIVEQPYNGPLSSAEWITESAAGNACGSGIAPAPGFPGYVICPLPPYNPPVQFSTLGVTGSGQMEPWTMVQDGVAVSTPGPYAAGSFTDTYTG